MGCNSILEYPGQKYTSHATAIAIFCDLYFQKKVIYWVLLEEKVSSLWFGAI